ncbi:hypothetical protein C7974DRAFT_199140 [Boeremia exigua]|uniref:uncharacterized protein n=1 Tax=Boeremia exigua TaxID=749465 RepID=UPI001E8EAED5|nr:uncharacterized protein C7974DRAFT_199140 [Boeremia exigua]KAH6625340.1 hypothetical protein C7974DRAFT_199140 [Boeremia exigua]
MYSVRNVLLTIALICVVPFSLGAPTPTQADTVTPHSITQFSYNSTGHGLDTVGTPSLLEAGMVTCGVTSRPGHDCAQNVCPPNEQCTVSDAGNCVFTNPVNTRPVGCRYCRCYKTSM